MGFHELIAGALSLPVVIGLAMVEPALGLAVGFVVYVAVLKALSVLRRPAEIHRLPDADPQHRLAA